MEFCKPKPLINLSGEFLVDLNNKLGHGATGDVYIGHNLFNRDQVAVKIINMSTITNQVTQYLLHMQKTALMILHNPYVLKGLKIIQTSEYCYMITQFCNGGTLKDLIKQQGKLNQIESLQLLILILKGYTNLVQKQIIHRDIKPDNIMLHNKEPKIIDFGYCQIRKYMKPKLNYNVGSPSYMAPETYEFNQYSQKSQIWALGATFYQCLTGNTFDKGQQMSQIFKQIKINKIQIPFGITQKSIKILKLCLQYDSRNRPNCQELLNEIFMVQIPINRIRNFHSMYHPKLYKQNRLENKNSNNKDPSLGSRFFQNKKEIFRTNYNEYMTKNKPSLRQFQKKKKLLNGNLQYLPLNGQISRDFNLKKIDKKKIIIQPLISRQMFTYGAVTYR